jgi:hypothetical protein
MLVYHSVFQNSATLVVYNSEEVVGCSAGYVGFASSWRWVKHQEIVIHLFVYLHDTGFVAASVAVIRRTENSHDFLVLCPIISLN